MTTEGENHDNRLASTGVRYANLGKKTRSDVLHIRRSPPLALSRIGKSTMILSGEEIRRNLGNQIIIDPFSEDRLNTNSYNLSLHHQLLVYEEVVLDVASPNRFRRIQIPDEGLTLQPGQLYLGRTVEHTETHGFVPRLQGRSSLARLGLFISPGTSLGEAGYCGTWTLEMFVIQPVKIYPAMQACQIYFHELHGAIETCGDRKYHNSEDIQPSQMYREFGESKLNEQLELRFEDILRATT